MSDRPYLAVLPVVILTASCQYNPFADRFVTQEPSWAEVAGSYVLQINTLTFSTPAPFEKNPPCIELTDGGTFRVTGFPDWRRGDRGRWRLHGQVSADGYWRGRIAGGVQTGSEYSSYWGIELKPHPISEPTDRWRRFEEHPGDPALGYNDGRFELIFGYGDGDAGNVLVFVRGDKNCPGEA